MKARFYYINDDSCWETKSTHKVVELEWLLGDPTTIPIRCFFPTTPP